MTVRQLEQANKALLEEVAKLKNANEQLDVFKSNFEAFLRQTTDFIYFKDIDSRFIFCSQTLAAITGHADWHEMIGKHDREVFPPDTAQIYEAEELPVFAEGRPLLNKINPYYDEAGRLRYVQTNKWPLFDGSGKVTGIFGISRDITELKDAEDQVRQLAFYDPLTQLPNRRLLNDRLIQALATSKRSGCYGALMFLDLDNFKPLNDTHGHVAGDLLLIEVAGRLRNCVREADTVSRFGGDEFVVVLNALVEDSAESAVRAGLIAEKIRSALSEPYQLTIKHEDKADVAITHQCTASVGVVLFAGHKASEDDIMRWADIAMYQAKQAGRNLVRFYNQTME